MRASVEWSPVRTSTGVSVPVGPLATAPPAPHTVRAACHGDDRPALRGHGRARVVAPAVVAGASTTSSGSSWTSGLRLSMTTLPTTSPAPSRVRSVISSEATKYPSATATMGLTNA